ncbi:MAG: hypothetical protein JWQ79_2368 [Mucilaginibacter sp.]|nr:hypothetical protein [Mucilaginibacter sp.]
MQMRLIYLMGLLFSFSLFSCNATYRKETKYTDFIIKSNKLYALTANGHINTLDINTEAVIDTNIHADTTITAISIDKTKNIVVAKSDQKTNLFNEQKQSFDNSFTATSPIYNIVFDNNNKEYLITENGITDVNTRKVYFPDSSFHYVQNFWLKPSAVLVDNNNNIWIGSARGEWGGKLCMFDTKTTKFIKPILDDIDPVNSIFSDGNSVYVSFGLAHMIITGSILKFTADTHTVIFNSKTDLINIEGKNKTVEGEFVGPAIYNEKNNCIYFYSQNGLFKGNKYKDLTKINGWTKVASPKLHWTSVGSHAVGPSMNILKMQFANNGKLFFVTQSDV